MESAIGITSAYTEGVPGSQGSRGHPRADLVPPRVGDLVPDTQKDATPTGTTEDLEFLNLVASAASVWSIFSSGVVKVALPQSAVEQLILTTLKRLAHR